MATNSYTGKADFKIGDDVYQTWYKVVGDLKLSGDDAARKTPLVVLHGGPGMSHHYMLPHEAIYEKAGIPVILYDQLGNGASSHIKDKPDTFWTPELFMDELDNLLAHLGIANNFDLLGNSWGGMLGAHYAATRVPKGLNHLIISNSPASVPLYEAGTNVLLDTFPADLIARLRSLEKEGKTDSSEYQEGMMKFYMKHVCTTDPWPKGLVDSFDAVALNPTVYNTMFGTSEFNITGTLKNWSIIDILHQISVPTLLISSPRDSVSEASYSPFHKNIPKVKWVEIDTSTHLPMYEDPERYFEVVIGLLL